jgi:hypothetical protein
MRLAVLVALFSANLLSRPEKLLAQNGSQFQPVTMHVYERPDDRRTASYGAHLHSKVGRIVLEDYYALTLALPIFGALKENWQ